MVTSQQQMPQGPLPCAKLRGLPPHDSSSAKVLDEQEVRERAISFTEKELSRFWRKVNKDGPLPDQSNPHYKGLGPCWTWTGGITGCGYGNAYAGGRQIPSHRFSFAVAFGYHPLNALHRCDNPKCVNPAHLFDGTKKDNFEDMVTKGRRKHFGPVGDKQARGTRINSNRLSESDVIDIRAMRASGSTAKEIAAAFTVGKTTIIDILTGKRWSWLK